MGDVGLLDTDHVLGPNLEMAAYFLVQETGKNRRGVKKRQAQPVNGTIVVNQGSGGAIADNGVVKLR